MGKSAGLPSCGAKEGNPCNASTGNKYQHERDLALPSGLGFERHYNSQQARRTALGLNWTHGWSHALKAGEGETLLYRPDGRILTYTLTDGAWTTDPDITLTLTALTDGWQVATPGGDVERYDADGHLLSLTDRLGRATTLAYDADARLTTVTGPFGRTLTLGYDTDGRIATLTDPAGAVRSYGYDAQGRLATVTDPAGGVRTYHYERDDFPQLLTGISDEAGVRYATWSYDSHGWATTSAHAGGAEEVSLTYHDDGTTRVTDTRGRTTDYRFEVIHGVPRPVEITTQ